MGHVYALDHDQRFAQLTRDNIARHHLRDHATILDAPLQTHSINDQNWQWYDDTALPRGIAIDILVVDGPPQHAIQDDLIRYPALPRLFHHLAPHATIIVDDADREAETAVVDPLATRVSAVADSALRATLWRFGWRYQDSTTH
jgi:hypothetical protein